MAPQPCEACGPKDARAMLDCKPCKGRGFVLRPVPFGVTSERWDEDEDGPKEKVIGERTVTCYHGYLTDGILRATPDSPC